MINKTCKKIWTYILGDSQYYECGYDSFDNFDYGCYYINLINTNSCYISCDIEKGFEGIEKIISTRNCYPCKFSTNRIFVI